MTFLKCQSGDCWPAKRSVGQSCAQEGQVWRGSQGAVRGSGGATGGSEGLARGSRGPARGSGGTAKGSKGPAWESGGRTNELGVQDKG